jgi:hypothetical protein
VLQPCSKYNYHNSWHYPLFCRQNTTFQRLDYVSCFNRKLGERFQDYVFFTIQESFRIIILQTLWILHILRKHSICNQFQIPNFWCIVYFNEWAFITFHIRRFTLHSKFLKFPTYHSLHPCHCLQSGMLVDHTAGRDQIWLSKQLYRLHQLRC